MYRTVRYSFKLIKDGSFKSKIKKNTQLLMLMKLIKSEMEDLPVEYFQIIMLDAKCQVIGTSLVTIGRSLKPHSRGMPDKKEHSKQTIQRTAKKTNR